jgi:hypothetical protein
VVDKKYGCYNLVGKKPNILMFLMALILYPYREIEPFKSLQGPYLEVVITSF